MNIDQETRRAFYRMFVVVAVGFLVIAAVLVVASHPLLALVFLGVALVVGIGVWLEWRT